MPARLQPRICLVPVILLFSVWMNPVAAVASAGPKQPAVPLSRIIWSDPSIAFGGFSGFALGPAATDEFYAITDRALLVVGKLVRSADGRLAGVRLIDGMKLRDRLGKPVQGFHADAEAVRRTADGSLLVGFESMTRIERFHPPDWQREQLQAWDALRDHWGNHGIEALALLGDGRALAVLEEPTAGPLYRTLIFSNTVGWTDGPGLQTDGAFMAVDAVIGPDGGLYLLERCHSLFWGYRSRISLYAPAAAGFDPPRVVMQTGWSPGDNYEGFDLWVGPDDHLIAILISDNNFNPLTPTVIAEYDLGPSPLQAGTP